MLIIKISALGDAVMASSMISAIRSKHPDAHITWFCGEEIFDLVKLFKGIDNILTVDNKLLSGGILNKIKFVFKCWKILLGKKFDLCVTGHSDFRYRLLSLSARCKICRRFGGRFGPLPGRYHGTEYVRLAIGHDHSIENPYPAAEINVLPSSLSKGMVLLLPGGARNIMRNDNLRGWPVEHYAALAEKLISKAIPVGLIGGKDDLWVEDKFKLLPVISFIGKTSVRELLELIAGASAVVAHDSGPMHMTYALNTPLAAIFGPVMPQTRLPAEIIGNVIYSDIPCSPCYDGRNYADCRDNICMRSIPVCEIVKKLEEITK